MFEGKDCGIAKLRELTERLPKFPPMIEGIVGSNGYREYQMDEGECFAWFIHRSGNDIAIHRWFNSKGTKFPSHAHPEKEWIIVYSGVMELHIDDGRVIELHKGDSYYNLPRSTHWAYFPEDCKYITITIPPAKEYPNG